MNVNIVDIHTFSCMLAKYAIMTLQHACDQDYIPKLVGGISAVSSSLALNLFCLFYSAE